MPSYPQKNQIEYKQRTIERDMEIEMMEETLKGSNKSADVNVHCEHTNAISAYGLSSPYFKCLKSFN